MQSPLAGTFKPVRFSGSCQIARDRKARPTAQIFLSRGQYQGNTGARRATAQMSFLWKNGKGAIFPFLFCKEKDVIFWRERRQKSLLPQKPFLLCNPA